MQTVIGIDEVGRGSWAGPLLVVAARATTQLPQGLADSKALTKQKREVIATQLQKVCSFGEGWVQPAEIDSLGLTDAMRLGVQRALDQLSTQPDDEIILDGHINYCDSTYTHVKTLVKADATVPIVSAASIYAKVTRDNYMMELSQKYPNYAFDKHVGYGTRSHRLAIERFGVCDLHRRSYKPIQVFL